MSDEMTGLVAQGVGWALGVADMDAQREKEARSPIDCITIGGAHGLTGEGER